MFGIIIIVISLILDGLLTNLLPYMVNNLSLLTPLLTVVTISLLYPYYRKKEKYFFTMVFITGIIYDLLYTNLLFFNGLLFLLIAYISKIINKNYKLSYFRLIIYIILMITVYESVTGLLLFIFRLVPITFYKIGYKIVHSLVLNIIYGEIIYLIINKLPKKYKKISIN